MSEASDASKISANLGTFQFFSRNVSQQYFAGGPGVRRKLIADQNRIAEDLLALHLFDTNPFTIAQLMKRGIFAGHVSQVFHDRQRDLAR